MRPNYMEWFVFKVYLKTKKYSFLTTLCFLLKVLFNSQHSKIQIVKVGTILSCSTRLWYICQNEKLSTNTKTKIGNLNLIDFWSESHMGKLSKQSWQPQQKIVKQKTKTHCNNAIKNYVSSTFSLNLEKSISQDMDGALHTNFAKSITNWDIITRISTFTTKNDMNSYKIWRI